MSQEIRYPLPLDAPNRASLRKLGQKLRPTVMIGKAGVTDEVVDSLERNLAANQLVKIRLQREAPTERDAAVAVLCERTGAECPGQIGHTFLLYRPKADGTSPDADS